ncbi:MULTISPECIES: hypothetical protein [unclassified Lentimicrobium]|uniref:hypothetical protein n=1 Tax=unclassified Lentimicrobium TaxID=2677434 RepID=UPI0015522C46|nr:MULTISPECIES: hypothetical protein [unclassified Lentimicrobium]NPD47574.1 hypothetical protein [Lentimicrobium sp. S6]NPD86919.1 hypothetical protein [Lentimicrobium sp. L6]
MSYTVGFDFGTHQTKVCIEDATNPAQKMYEFLEFRNKDGYNSVLFPSIVQINKDETLSYGFIDEEQCKVEIDESIRIPELHLNPEPVYKLPEEPQMPKLPDKPSFENLKQISWKEQLKRFVKKEPSEKKTSLKKWEKECKSIKELFETEHKAWKKKTNDLMDEFQLIHENWKQECRKVTEEHEKIVKQLARKREHRLRFRYFKLASFSNIKWNDNIAPELLSVWYIANVILILQEKLGEDFFIQFGVPSGSEKAVFDSQKRKAYAFLIAAYRLVEKIKTKSDYLKLTYPELKEQTKIDYNFTEEELYTFGLNVVPEAFAGLSSITQQKRIQDGMSLLVDIGGGTTDIAFFTLNGTQPDIHSVISFPKGLNYIFEQYIGTKDDMDIRDVQELFFTSQGDISLFKSSITTYHNQLKNNVSEMKDAIIDSFSFRKDIHKLPIDKLIDALKNRPIVFSGGGSIYKSMRKGVSNFSDVNIINKNLLNIPFVVNTNIDDTIYPILSTSYGLSIPLEEEIQLTEIEDVFNHIVSGDSDINKYKFEHGLTDY